MAKITFEVGDIVKVAGDKVGIVLPDKKVLVTPKEVFNSRATLSAMAEKDLFPMQIEEVNQLDYSLRIAFKAVLTVLGIDSSKIVTTTNVRQ